MVSDNWTLQPPDVEEEEEEVSTEEEITEEVVDEVEEIEEESTTETEAPSFADKSEVESLKSMITDLTRSVGRIQSLSDRLNNSSNDEVIKDLRTQLSENYSNTTDLLTELVSGLDPDLVSPTVLAKVQEAKEASTRAAAKASLEELVEQMVDQRVPKRPEPDTQTTTGGKSPLEIQIEEEIQSYDLDPDSDYFDWKEAQALFNQQPDMASAERAVKTYFRTKIREAVLAENSATARQVRKESAGKAPKPGGPVGSEEDQLKRFATADPGGENLESSMQLLKKILA